MTKGKPRLRIAPQADGTVTLTIWDILIDLDITIGGLKYYKEELEAFLRESRDNQSFAFTLGFPPGDGVKAAIASTKRDSNELITLYGYTYKA